jgi:pimeloyl-ACP methyl ester carboxylesterase
MPVMFGRTFLDDPMRRSERREWEKRLVGNSRSIWRAVNGVIEREGVLDELTHITCPTLVLHGDEDAAILRRRAWLAHQGIAGSKFVAIPRAGHTPTVEEPEAVNEALAEFLGTIA